MVKLLVTSFSIARNGTKLSNWSSSQTPNCPEIMQMAVSIIDGFAQSTSIPPGIQIFVFWRRGRDRSTQTCIAALLSGQNFVVDSALEASSVAAIAEVVALVAALGC
jgi:hypothetical protein